MYIGWRDLRFAKGRFALIASVVGLITVLVGFLVGLTGGLAMQNISGVLDLPGDKIVLAQSEKANFSDSRITAEQQRAWAGRADTVVPLGISQTRATVGEKSAPIAVFATPTGQANAPQAGTIVLPTQVAQDLGVKPGDRVNVQGSQLTVAVTDAQQWYSHMAVAHLSLTDWQQMMSATGQGDGQVSALLVSGVHGDDVPGTVSKGKLSALQAIPAFGSEIGSLGMMIGLLLGISALVVGAFFTVWTLQRRPDLAVLKALGASTKALVRDALGQAVVVLVIGVGLGTALVTAVGIPLAGVLPFVISPLTTLAPAALLVLLGLIGAVAALRPVATADPLTALGAGR